MSAPLVTVVVPAYNAERFLAETLEAVLAQDYSPIELIVVDDGSSDSTADVVARFASARYLRQENSGPSAARNAGISASTGELITFCDSDDTYRPDKVSAQVRYLAAHPDVDCVMVHHRTFVEPGTEPPDWMAKDDEGVQSPMIRRSVLDAVGGYDPSYRMAETMEWLGRMKGAGLQVDVLDDVLVERRLHGSNLSYDRKDLQRGLLTSLHARLQAARSGSSMGSASSIGSEGSR